MLQQTIQLVDMALEIFFNRLAIFRGDIAVGNFHGHPVSVRFGELKGHSHRGIFRIALCESRFNPASNKKSKEIAIGA
jgi:hypothetical protein